MADVRAVALKLHSDPLAAPGTDDEEAADEEVFGGPNPDPGDEEEVEGIDHLGLEEEVLSQPIPDVRVDVVRTVPAPRPAAIDSEPCARAEDLRPGEPGESQRIYELANLEAIRSGAMPRWKPPATSPTAASVASGLAVMMSLGGVNISVHVQNRFDRLKQLATDKQDYWALLDKSMDESDPDHKRVKKALQLIGYLDKWRLKTPQPPRKDNYPESVDGAAKYEAAKVRYHARLAKHEGDRHKAERWLKAYFPNRGQYLKQLAEERKDAGIRFSDDSRDLLLAKCYGQRPDVQRVKEHEARKAEEAAERKETPAKKNARVRGIAAFKRVWARVSSAPATEEQMLYARQNANKRSKTLLNPADREERDDKRAADELAAGAASQNNEYKEMIARLEQREADYLAREQAYSDDAAAYLAERRAKKDKRDRDALDVVERRDIRGAELAAARVFSSGRFVVDQETGERLDPQALLARYEKARAREFQAVKRRKEARDEFYRTHVDDLESVEVHIVVHHTARMGVDWESPVSLDNLRVSDNSAGSSREHAGKA